MSSDTPRPFFRLRWKRAWGTSSRRGGVAGRVVVRDFTTEDAEDTVEEGVGNVLALRWGRRACRRQRFHHRGRRGHGGRGRGERPRVAVGSQGVSSSEISPQRAASPLCPVDRQRRPDRFDFNDDVLVDQKVDTVAAQPAPRPRSSVSSVVKSPTPKAWECPATPPGLFFSVCRKVREKGPLFRNRLRKSFVLTLAAEYNRPLCALSGDVH